MQSDLLAGLDTKTAQLIIQLARDDIYALDHGGLFGADDRVRNNNVGRGGGGGGGSSSSGRAGGGRGRGGRGGGITLSDLEFALAEQEREFMQFWADYGDTQVMPPPPPYGPPYGPGTSGGGGDGGGDDDDDDDGDDDDDEVRALLVDVGLRSAPRLPSPSPPQVFWAEVDESIQDDDEEEDILYDPQPRAATPVVPGRVSPTWLPDVLLPTPEPEDEDEDEDINRFLATYPSPPFIPAPIMAVPPQNYGSPVSGPSIVYEEPLLRRSFSGGPLIQFDEEDEEDLYPPTIFTSRASCQICP